MKKKQKSLYKTIYKWLQARPFCGCGNLGGNVSIYAAYCARVAETVTDEMES